MADTPQISVIVPIYKVERYIKLCIDSILMQTFQDFEIILVDDASPDNCVELCQKLYGGIDKIKLVRHEKNLTNGVLTPKVEDKVCFMVSSASRLSAKFL